MADLFERCSRKILEAADLIEIDSQPFAVLTVEADQTLGLYPGFDSAGDLGGSCMDAFLGHNAGGEPEAKDIENQRNLPVAEDRRSGKW